MRRILYPVLLALLLSSCIPVLRASDRANATIAREASNLVVVTVNLEQDAFGFLLLVEGATFSGEVPLDILPAGSTTFDFIVEEPVACQISGFFGSGLFARGFLIDCKADAQPE